MSTTTRLDHAVINVRYDLDGAESLFEALGFTLTPRGYHSHGSQNHLMMFADDYLELIAIPEGEPIERRDLVDAALGINGVVFGADDVDEVFARLDRLGFAGEPPRAFHRPVTIDGDEHDARFRTVTVRADVFPAGRVYFCEHATPELVWRPEWQRQANGIDAITGVVTVTADASAEAERFAALLDTDVIVDGAGDNVVELGSTRLTVMTPEHYQDRYGPLASALGDRVSLFGALTLATANRAAFEDRLGGIDGVVVATHDDRTLVRLPVYDAVLEVVDSPETPTR